MNLIVTNNILSRLNNKPEQLTDFEKIYKQYYRMMHRVAIKVLGDKEVADDIIQEVFVYLYQKLKQTKNITHYSSWLYRATYNKCIDHIRLQSKQIRITDEQQEQIEEPSNINIDQEKYIKQALNKLKPEEKIMAVLYSESLSYKEISEVTGVKVTSVGKTLSRILKKLEKELKGKQYELFE